MPATRSFAPARTEFDSLADLLTDADRMATRIREMLESRRFSDDTESAMHALMFTCTMFGAEVSGSRDALYGDR